jgi:hypothetical protein
LHVKQQQEDESPMLTIPSSIDSCVRLAAGLVALLACCGSGAALAQDAKLTLSPALIVTGATDRLAIESDGSFDLSKVAAQQIAISPDHDVRGIKVLDTGPKSVGIALDLSTNAQLGTRAVSVTVDGKVAKGTLDIIQGAALVVEWPGAAAKSKAVTTTLNVVARGGVDLSQIKPADVKFTPTDFGVVEIIGQSADGLTLGLKVPASKKNASGTVRVGGDVNLAADFSFAGAHAAKTCGKLQHCCGADAAKCTSCVPIDQVCRKPGS